MKRVFSFVTNDGKRVNRQLTPRCACGRPIDTGWTCGGWTTRAVCLICETERIMATFVWPPHQEARHG